MPSKGPQSRHWAFTCFTLCETEESRLEPPAALNLQYLVYQIERCPTTQRLHFQGFFTSEKRLRGTAIRKHWFLDNAEPPKKSVEACIRYAQKEDTRVAGPFEWGTPPANAGQGARSDVHAFAEAVKSGLSEKEVFEAYPEQWLKYGAKINAIRSLDAPATKTTSYHLCLGRPGVGKTTWAINKAKEISDKQPFVAHSGQWFDGYIGGEPMILDEVLISATLFKQLSNDYTLKLPVKGSFATFWSSDVFFCTNKNPENWYDTRYAMPEAICRRFFNVVYWYGNRTDPECWNMFRVYDDWDEFKKSEDYLDMQAFQTGYNGASRLD